MDQANKVFLSRQGKILGLELQKRTVFEPDTSRTCVQWMIFRGDMEIHMGESADCSARDLARDILPGLNPQC